MKHYEHILSLNGLWVNHALWGWLLIKPTVREEFWQGYCIPEGVHPLLRLPSRATKICTWPMHIPKMNVRALDRALNEAYAKRLIANATEALLEKNNHQNKTLTGE